MSLHNDSIVIDGLIIAKWERSVFDDMRKGGLTAANCTVSVWEGFTDTVDNIAEMKQKAIARQQEYRKEVETQLTDVQVIRIGTISIDMYIVGKTADGAWAGVYTSVVET